MNLNDLPGNTFLEPDSAYFWPFIIWAILFSALSIIAIFLFFKSKNFLSCLIPMVIAILLSIPMAFVTENVEKSESQSRDDAVNSWINSTYDLKEVVALQVETSGGKWSPSTSLNIRNGGAYYALRVDTDGNLVLLEGVSEAPLKEASSKSK